MQVLEVFKQNNWEPLPSDGDITDRQIEDLDTRLQKVGMSIASVKDCQWRFRTWLHMTKTWIKKLERHFSKKRVGVVLEWIAANGQFVRDRKDVETWGSE